MNESPESSTRADSVRAFAVLAAAVLQIAGGIVGGPGLLGESVSSVANGGRHELSRSVENVEQMFCQDL